MDPYVDGSWWPSYHSALALNGLGADSRLAIDMDAAFIVDQCICGTAEVAITWPNSQLRRGAVVGAVQSGKTASMLAVTSKALDRGVDAVVILAGTRTALWLQTMERIDQQLDCLPQPSLTRVRLPSTEAARAVSTGGDLRAAYGLSEQLAARALDRGRPVLAVVMKNVHHLEQLGRTLHEVLYPLVATRDDPFHLLVIDDEADDASVEDARVTGLLAVQQKQVPRRILDLWEARSRPGTTVLPQVRATYVAYTATPQANLLQDLDNPLAPQHFLVALRMPGRKGDVEKRSSSYRVPEGLKGWYTGGDIFYNSLTAAPLHVTLPDAPSPQDLHGAVRAYLVASAVRLLREPDRAGPVRGPARHYSTREEARRALAAPMSMLVHPSMAKNEHFQVAAELLAWSREEPAAVMGREDEDRGLGTAGVARDMRENEALWVDWLQRYAATAAACADEFALKERPTVPSADEWPSVRELILEEIVPGTNVAVINSDERADEPPEFEPVAVSDGWRAPKNMSTIFVSGNVMSRGLTLEGLTTTLFTRSSDDPLADTQMQMQRWFGYRGKYVDVCRLFATEQQLALFRAYHDADEALRRDVLADMEQRGDKPAEVSVLQGRSFKATGKIRGVRSLPLYPGPRPFIRLMNEDETEDESNLTLVRDLFRQGSVGVPDAGAQRGLLLDDSLDLLAAADLIDQLRYRKHGPGTDGPEARPWRSVERQLGLGEGEPAYPLFRAPAVSPAEESPSPSPYALAAYLRLWHACLERRAPGFVSTDEPPLRWSLADLSRKRDLAPRFRVGLRFGSLPALQQGPLIDLDFQVRPMDRGVTQHYLDATWGARGETEDGIWGDEFFDFYGRDEVPALTPTGARAPGSEGLILFHVIGRGSGGATLAVGLSIPAGGPDQIHAARTDLVHAL